MSSRNQNKLKLKVCLAVVAVATSLISSIVAISRPTSAVSDVVTKKAIGYAISQCYKQGSMLTPVTAETYDQNWGDIASQNGSYVLPTGTYEGTYSLTCYALLYGNGLNGTFPGAFSLAGITSPETADNVSAFDAFMTSMGYTKHSAAGGGKCASYTWTADTSTDTIKFCAETDSQGRITGDFTSPSANGVNAEFEISGTSIRIDCSQLVGYGGCQSHTAEKGVTNFDTFAGEILNDLITNRKNGVLGGSWKLVESVNIESRGDTLAEYKLDNLNTAANKAIKYLTGYNNVNALKLSPAEQQSLLTDYLLNFYGVERYGGACNLDSSQASIAEGAGYSKIETSMFGAGLQTCWVRPTKNKQSSVTAYNSQGFFDGTLMDYDDIIKALGGSVNEMLSADKEKCNQAANNAREAAGRILDMVIMQQASEEDGRKAQATIDSLDAIKNEHGQYWHEENGSIACYEFTGLDGSTVETPTESTDPSVTNPGNTDPSGGENTSSITACYENAGVLGWIACPVLEVVGGMVGGLYEYVENNFLQVKSSLINSDGVKEGWGIFRDFANIIFVVLFIIIILSQLTGIGISNYGIKKTLPRLIVVVVLVNISFILCQLAVDASNILGSGLRSMFGGFASRAATAAGGGVPFNLGAVAGGIIGSLFTVGAAGAVTAVFAFTIPWELWLFPVLLTLIGCVISILFFFILLGVRQAGVIILVTLAPAAIVCYALPNTKSVFDRWKKLFIALLLVYPICGVLMGGGQFASTLLLIAAHETGDAGAFFTVVAMLLQVVPFFFVPSILKGSMAAMGNLGMKISGFGSRMSAGLQRGIRNSEMGRDFQRSMNMKYLDRSAGKIEKQQGRLWGKAFKGWKQKRLGRYNTAYNRYSFEDIRAGGAATRIKPGSAEYGSLIQGQKAEQFNKDVEGRQSLYKDGLAKSAIHTGGTVNGNDEDAMIEELDHYLESIIDGIDSGKTADDMSDNLKNAQAIINNLSDTGRGSTMAKVENSFLKALQSRGAVLTGATGDKKKQLDMSFGALGTRTNRKYGAAYKKISPAAAAMLGDISKGQYGRAGTIRSVTELENDGSIKRDSAGSPITHLASSTYSGSGLSGINPEDLSKMKAHHLGNVLDSIQRGEISGSNAMDVAGAADEVLAHPEQFATDADTKAYIERIRNAALASSAVPTGGTRTTGAMALGRASDGAINSMLNSIQGAQNWGSLSADEQTQYGQLVANIHDTLSTDMHTAEGAEQLKQALSIAKSKGFINAATGAVVSEYTGPTKLKITHANQQKAPVPHGWTETGIWVGGGTGPTRQQQIAYEEWARHSAEVDRRNSTP